MQLYYKTSERITKGGFAGDGDVAFFAPKIAKEPIAELPDFPRDVFAPPPATMDRNKEANELSTFAASSAQAGDFEMAVEWQKKANQLYTIAEDRKKGEERLRLYQQRKSYREDNK